MTSIKQEGYTLYLASNTSIHSAGLSAHVSSFDMNTNAALLYNIYFKVWD